jgi:hypothetical protein
VKCLALRLQRESPTVAQRWCSHVQLHSHVKLKWYPLFAHAGGVSCYTKQPKFASLGLGNMVHSVQVSTQLGAMRCRAIQVPPAATAKRGEERFTSSQAYRSKAREGCRKSTPSETCCCRAFGAAQHGSLQRVLIGPCYCHATLSCHACRIAEHRHDSK